MPQQHRGRGEEVAAEQDEVDADAHMKAAQDVGATAAEATAEVEATVDDIDAILADIDEVLTPNAEDFVRSFIQKGGQ